MIGGVTAVIFRLALGSPGFGDAMRVESLAVTPIPWSTLLRANGVVAVVLLGGIVTLGASSVIGLFQVGFDIALAISSALDRGVGVSLVLAMLLPHVIPELAGFVVLGTAGLTGWEVAQTFSWGGSPDWRRTARCVTRRTCLGIALLGIAGILEIYITPSVVEVVLVVE